VTHKQAGSEASHQLNRAGPVKTSSVVPASDLNRRIWRRRRPAPG